MQLDVSTDIARPAEAVFRFIVTDHAVNHPRWDPSLTNFRQVGEGPVQPGTRFAFERKMMGRKVHMEIEVTSVEPGQGMRFSITGAPWEVQWQLLATPTGEESARLTSRGGGNPAGLWKLFDSMVEKQLAASTKEGQLRIKEMLENEGGSR